MNQLQSLDEQRSVRGEKSYLALLLGRRCRDTLSAAACFAQCYYSRRYNVSRSPVEANMTIPGRADNLRG
jgi:hypothetical protein